MKERFLHLNATIPYFIMFNHNQSGQYSQVSPQGEEKGAKARAGDEILGREREG